MNPLQPTTSWSAVRQRMDERERAATSYRLARLVEPKTSLLWSRIQAMWHGLQANVGWAINRWRDRAGNALIGLGAADNQGLPGSQRGLAVTTGDVVPGGMV